MSLYTPWLRFIAPPKTDDVIKEKHEGSCGFNMVPRSMVVRITKQGYYWLSMHRDVARIIQDCEKCKEQSAVRKKAKIGAIAAGNAWPFKHSTKWIEAKPLTAVNARHIERFVWEYVRIENYTIFLPHHRIHGDNKQNREATNSKPTRMVGQFTSGIVDIQYTSKKQPEETPFSLTYGFEAIISKVKSIVAKDDRGRTKEVTKRKESKEVASIEEAFYQNELRMYHSKRSNHSTYKVGDFVLLLQNNTENPWV
ncbi:reverse transcriptase domain-containing protein [Tanacetum coccineum]